MALGHTHSANFTEYSHLNLKDHKDTATDTRSSRACGVCCWEHAWSLIVGSQSIR
jgi:hypothetical protein